jgi:hypothetical protein
MPAEICSRLLDFIGFDISLVDFGGIYFSTPLF